MKRSFPARTWRSALNILLAALMVTLGMGGCSAEEPTAEELLVRGWQEQIYPDSGIITTGRHDFLPTEFMAPTTHTTGTAGVLFRDADRDGQPEMLHLRLTDNKEMGEEYMYSSGVTLTAELYELQGEDIQKSDEVVLSGCMGWAVDSVRVFLSDKNELTYLCCEQISRPLFPDGSDVVLYQIYEYTGSGLEVRCQVFDPGFSSGTGLYGDTEYNECLYLMEEGMLSTEGRYDDYEKALISELRPYGIELDYLDEHNYSFLPGENNTLIFDFNSVCSFDGETMSFYDGSVSVTDHTGAAELVPEKMPQSDPDAPFQEVSDSDIDIASPVTIDPDSTGALAVPGEYFWYVQPRVTADDINVIRRFRPRFADEENYEKQDYNSEGMHMYDSISAIRKSGKDGFISYSGLPMSDTMFTDVSVGYDSRYMAQIGFETFYTLSSLHELVRIDENEAAYINGSSPDGTLTWSESTAELGTIDIGGYGHAIPLASHGEEYLEASAARYYPDPETYTEKFVLVNNGRRITDEIYDNAGHFADGIIPVEKDGKWGYVDENGNTVLPFEYEGCWDTVGMENITDIDDSKVSYYTAYDASDGCVVVRKDGQYALYDVTGRQLIDYGEFEAIRPVYEGLFWAKKDGKWGVVSLVPDPQIFTVIPPEEECSEQDVTVRSGNGLRMRTGPGTGYEVEGVLSNHRAAVLCGHTDEWAYIRVDGVYGWVLSEYLD